MLAEIFQLKDPLSIEVKLMINRMIGSWSSARGRVREEEAMVAQARAHGEPLEMPKSAFLTLLSAFQERREGERTPDRELPAKGMIDDILEQLNDGELAADLLTEVVSREQEITSQRAAPKEHQLSLRADGSWTRRPKRLSVKSPSNEKELRKAYVVMAKAWEFVKLKKTPPAESSVTSLSRRGWTTSTGSLGTRSSSTRSTWAPTGRARSTGRSC